MVEVPSVMVKVTEEDLKLLNEVKRTATNVVDSLN